MTYIENVILFGIIWIIGYSIFLYKHGKDMESFDIFLGYTGGTIAFGLFGVGILAIFLIFYIPTKLIDWIRK
jgi:hypothetical protein